MCVSFWMYKNSNIRYMGWNLFGWCVCCHHRLRIFKCDFLLVSLFPILTNFQFLHASYVFMHTYISLSNRHLSIFNFFPFVSFHFNFLSHFQSIHLHSVGFDLISFSSIFMRPNKKKNGRKNYDQLVAKMSVFVCLWRSNIVVVS